LRISLILLTSCIRFQSSATENGVSHAPIQLLHGDFLKNSAVKDAISTAGLVYMNNPKFGPELNLKILGMNFISTRNMLLFTHQTSNVIDNFLTDQLCPLMPKGCKLVLFTPSSSSIQPSPRISDPSLRFASTAWSGLEAILGKPTATCWVTKSLLKFVIFKKRLRQTFSRHAGWWRCSLVEALRCRFARFRKNLIDSSKYANKGMSIKSSIGLNCFLKRELETFIFLELRRQTKLRQYIQSQATRRLDVRKWIRYSFKWIAYAETEFQILKAT
jgi:hypothetical protein